MARKNRILLGLAVMLLLIACCAGLALWGSTRHRDMLPAADPIYLPAGGKTPSMDFVSLEVTDRGGWGGSHQLLITEGHARETRNGGFYTPHANQSREAALTREDMAAIALALNDAHFPSLAGDYRQNGLHDADSQRVSLTLKDAIGHQSVYAYYNYGRVAPPAYYLALDQIGKVLNRRFPPFPAAPPAQRSTGSFSGRTFSGKK